MLRRITPTASRWLLAAASLVLAVPPKTECAPARERIDLRQAARVAATHTKPAGRFDIKNALDGDPKTHWCGDGHSLTSQPANVIIEFQQPAVIQRLVLTSVLFQGELALKEFEVYAWADKSWAGAAPLAAVKDAREVRTAVKFAPVQTRRLRLRLRDTWRADHGLPRLSEIEVFAAPPGAKTVELKDAPIADERRAERELVARALAETPRRATAQFDPARGYLFYVRSFLDTMIAEGTDRYGATYTPMFASLLDLDTHSIPDDPPANIEGQRPGDRAVRGGNLFHDIMTLRACDYATSLTGEGKYRESATRYLKYFLDHCPQRTGLFPWGEHACWDFFREAPGSTTHEFLGGIPLPFWERAWQLDARAVLREADGLINHVVNLDTYDFNRHANIAQALPIPRPAGLGFLDFPRHAGFIVNVWTFAYAKTGDAKYRDWSLQLLDHHWRLRNPNSGLPRLSLEPGRANLAGAGSAFSLAVSVLEGARLLPAGAMRSRYEEVARAYMDSNLRLPHRPLEGKLVGGFPLDSRPEDAKGQFSNPYYYGYGSGFTADGASLFLAAYRLTGDERARQLAARCAEFYAAHDPPAPTEIVRAHVYASIIGLFCDLYDLEHEGKQLEQAERYARLAIERLYDGGLFRGATGIEHYEGDMMVGNLAYNLAWLHALKTGAKVKLEPNYFNR